MQNKNTNVRRVKILLLGYNDNELEGHVFSHYQNLPQDKFEKRLVVLASLGKRKDYAFFYRVTKKILRIKFKLYRICNMFREIVMCHSLIICNKKREEFHFYNSEGSNIKAKEILNKNSGFIPDVIGIYWTAGFLNAKIIRDLYDLTGANILFFLVDEAHLTGGCHYPNECKGYLYGCHSCPALLKGRKLAEIQMASKIKYWKSMPKIICGVKSDCQLAQQSPLFQDAYFIPFITVPNVTITDYQEARRKWSIATNLFVILLGANSIDDKRKGMKYAVEAINKFAEKKNNLCLFLLGNQSSTTIQNLGIKSNIKVISPGFLSLKELFLAFCASDCHISPSIADSGPMMVNYSIACGTPVIAFSIGIACDIVLHKETGYIAQYKNSMDIVVGLDWYYQLDAKNKDKIRQKCISLMSELKMQKTYYDMLYNYVINGKI